MNREIFNQIFFFDYYRYQVIVHCNTIASFTLSNLLQ